jgi:2-polyprenyl-3-methyl-5-hydroxy-6-metoxy-1,4-benzoquinol methylase
MKKIKKRKSCILCEKKKLKIFLPLKNNRLGDLYFTTKYEKHDLDNKYDFSVYYCNNCFHYQLKTIINSEFTWSNYFFQTTNKMKNNNHYYKYVKNIYSFFKKKPKTILDIGSNDGYLLNIFKKKIQYVLGVDASKKLAYIANKNKIKTHYGYFNQKLANELQVKYKKKFDLITANNVLSHNDDLPSFIKGVKQLLSDEGVFVTEISYLPDILKKNYFLGTVFHEHTSYHTLYPLNKLIKKNNLKIVKCEKNKLQGGSLVCYIVNERANYKKHYSVNKILFSEKKENFLNPEKTKKYLIKLYRNKILLNNILRKLKKKKAKLFAFGSSISSATFINFFNLEKRLDFIVDDDKRKQNKFHSCNRISIVSSEYMKKIKNAYGLIFAWEHNDKIIKKFSDYVGDTTGFIKIFPNVVLIKNK